MAVRKLESRVAALETEVTQLKQKLATATPSATTEAEIPWWREIYGTFADDPLYEKAMRLGREYRESLRPKPTE